MDPIKWGTIWEQGKPDKGTPPGQIQDKQGEEDTEEPDTKGKKNKDGEALRDVKKVRYSARLWNVFIQSQKGKNNSHNK